MKKTAKAKITVNKYLFLAWFEIVRFRVTLRTVSGLADVASWRRLFGDVSGLPVSHPSAR